MSLVTHRYPSRTRWLYAGVLALYIGVMAGAFAISPPTAAQGTWVWVLLLPIPALWIYAIDASRQFSIADNILTTKSCIHKSRDIDLHTSKVKRLSKGISLMDQDGKHLVTIQQTLSGYDELVDQVLASITTHTRVEGNPFSAQSYTLSGCLLIVGLAFLAGSGLLWRSFGALSAIVLGLSGIWILQMILRTPWAIGETMDAIVLGYPLFKNVIPFSRIDGVRLLSEGRARRYVSLDLKNGKHVSLRGFNMSSVELHAGISAILSKRKH